MRVYFLHLIWHIMCVCVGRPVTLIFDLLTLKLVCNKARFMGYSPANFGDTTTIRFWFMGHWANTAQTDHVILRPWSLTLEVMAPAADAGRRPPSVTKFKFVGLAIRKTWCTMCVSINGPSGFDLWPFDLETGMRVASKVGNLPSKFGHARPLGSRIIRYVRDERTDRQTDGQTGGRRKATLIAPSLQAGHNSRTHQAANCSGVGSLGCEQTAKKHSDLQDVLITGVNLCYWTMLVQTQYAQFFEIKIYRVISSVSSA